MTQAATWLGALSHSSITSIANRQRLYDLPIAPQSTTLLQVCLILGSAHRFASNEGACCCCKSAAIKWLRTDCKDSFLGEGVAVKGPLRMARGGITGEYPAEMRLSARLIDQTLAVSSSERGSSLIAEGLQAASRGRGKLLTEDTEHRCRLSPLATLRIGTQTASSVRQGDYLPHQPVSVVN